MALIIADDFNPAILGGKSDLNVKKRYDYGIVVVFEPVWI